MTTLASPGKALAATSINITSATGWPTDTGIVFAIRTVDSNGKEVAGTYTEWVGTLSGTVISGLTGTPAFGSDQVYAAGATTQVYIPVSSYAHNRLITGLLVAHNQDGTHTSSLTLTTPTIGSFVNATHNHTNTAGGGKLTSAGITSLDLSLSTLSNPYKFSAYKSSGTQTASDGAKVTFDAEDFDTNNNFDSVTNNRYVAPVNGFYYFNAAVYVSSAPSVSYLFLKKNGSSLKRGQIASGAGLDNVIVFSGLVQLVATDYVELFFSTNVGGTHVIQNASGGERLTYFEGFLVSTT